MKRTLLVAAAAAALVACSGTSNREASPTTRVTTTTVAPTTTIKPTTTTSAKPRVGATQYVSIRDQSYYSKGSATVLAYTNNATLPQWRKDFAPNKNQRYVGIQVRVCLSKDTFPDPTTVSWDPWNLLGHDGSTYEAAGDYYPDTLIQPLFPQGKILAVGNCRKGWIPFAVPNGWKPDSVEYNADSADQVLTWEL